MEMKDMKRDVPCKDCIKCNPNRKNDDKIRCTRFSMWVDPNESACGGGVTAEEAAFFDYMNNQLKNVTVKPTGKQYEYGG